MITGGIEAGVGTGKMVAGTARRLMLHNQRKKLLEKVKASPGTSTEGMSDKERMEKSGLSDRDKSNYKLLQQAQRMGMDRDKDWKEQMYETQQSRSGNIFEDRAKRQEQRELDAKTKRKSGKSSVWDKF